MSKPAWIKLSEAMHSYLWSHARPAPLSPHVSGKVCHGCIYDVPDQELHAIPMGNPPCQVIHQPLTHPAGWRVASCWPAGLSTNFQHSWGCLDFKYSSRPQKRRMIQLGQTQHWVFFNVILMARVCLIARSCKAMRSNAWQSRCRPSSSLEGGAALPISQPHPLVPRPAQVCYCKPPESCQLFQRAGLSMSIIGVLLILR